MPPEEGNVLRAGCVRRPYLWLCLVALGVAAQPSGAWVPAPESGSYLVAAQQTTAIASSIPDDVARLAQQFVDLHEMDPFPHELPVPEAYRWQDEFAEQLGPFFGGIVGYKTGGHDSGPSNPYFPPGGIRGILLEGMIKPSGFTVRPDDTVWGFLEADLAFRVGDESINVAETDLEILAGLDAVVPFLEIPDPAFDDNGRSQTGTIVTNMASRYAFVGDPVPLAATEEWEEKLATFTFAVHDERGREIGAGTMEGHYRPLTVVAWLRDQLRESGKRLRPGDLLSLGNIGITSPLKADSPRGGPAYASDQFTLSYYGLSDDGPATVTINIAR